MEHTECLNCALHYGNNTPCKFDYTLLKYLYSKERYREKEIHVSDLLQCPRKSFYEKTEEPVVSAYKRLVTSFGTLQHKLLEEIDSKYIDSELMLDGDDLVGTADVVYKDGRLVDFKTTRKINKKYLPKESHKLQVNIYAHLLRLNGREVKSAAIQYMDFMGPSMCSTCKAYVEPDENGELHCPICGRTSDSYHLGAYLVEVELLPEEEVAKLVDERIEYLRKCLDNDEVPEPDPGFLCRYCPFIAKCPAGQGEVYGF